MSSFDNVEVSLQGPSNGGLRANRGPLDPEDAAVLFAEDLGWREKFLAELEHQRKVIVADRDSAVAEANQRLMALEGILPKPPIEPPGAPPPKLRKLPKALDKQAAVKDTASALVQIRLAGKEGIASRTLGGILGTSAGPLVRPLLDSKQVRQKGTAGATRYYAL